MGEAIGEAVIVLGNVLPGRKLRMAVGNAGDIEGVSGAAQVFTDAELSLGVADQVDAKGTIEKVGAC